MSDDKVKKFEELIKLVDKEYTAIYNFSKKPVNEKDPDSIAERLARSAEHLTTSGRLKTHAKYILTIETAAIRTRLPDAHKEQREAEVAEAQRRLDSCDRLNASLTHQIDALRSLLSWWKEDRVASRTTSSPR